MFRQHLAGTSETDGGKGEHIIISSGAVTEALQQPAVVPRGQKHVSNLDPDSVADLDMNMSTDMTVS